MAVRIQLRRDTAQHWYENNPVLRPGEIGIETDTLKMKVGPLVEAPAIGTAWNSINTYMNVVPSDFNTTLNGYLETGDVGVSGGVVGLNNSLNAIIPGSSLIIEGATDNTYETTLTVTDPTADRTITLPDATTTLVGNDTSDTLTNKTITSPVVSGLTLSDASIVFEGAVADSYETTLTVGEPTADRTITIPDVTGTIVTTGDTGTVTNTMLAGSIANDKLAGSISNDKLAGSISNDKLSNSAITINGESTSLGGTRTLYTDDISEDGSPTNLWFTDDRAQDAVATALSNGTHTNISVSYDDSNNAISLTGAVTYTDENAQDAVGNAVGNGLDYDDSTGAISVDPSEFTLNSIGSPTADVNLASYKITNLAAPTSSNDAATKSYVDNITAGLNFHAAVHVATTSDLSATYNNTTKTLSASGTFPTIDGETITETQRVLVKSQTDAKENGIYELTDDGDPSGTWVLTRAADADNTPSGEISYGDFVFVQTGATNGGYGYIMTSTGTITLGSSNINWTQFNTGQAVIAGNGLTETTPGTLVINTAVTVDLNTSQTLTNKTITGSFTGSLTGNADTVTNGVVTTGSYSDPSWITSLAKSKVGLGNVENTALSTWAGTSNITTLGTITTGTWTGTTIAVANGGTGATDAGTARTNLGLAIGTDVQAYNSTLAAVAGGTYTGDDSITTLGTIATGTWSASTIALDKGGTGATTQAGAANAVLPSQTSNSGKYLTSDGTNVSWATVDALPSQTGNSGKYLTTDGSTASWASLVVPITTGTATISSNTATTIDTNALSEFTSVEYMVSLKQGSKVRTSKVILQTDGTSVDMTEFAITETGGTMSGVVVSASVVSTNAVLQVTVTDAASTNVTVKFSEVKL